MSEMNNRIATIGFFDGVHLGHRFLFSHLQEEGKKRGLEPTIVTFQEHPREVLRMGYRPQLLTSLQERVALLEHYASVQLFRFDRIRYLTAAQFMRLLHEQYHVQCLLIGYDHHFGSDRLSSPDEYRRIGESVGVEVLLMDQYKLDNRHISSTEIRQSLLEGNIELANRLLGYDYSLSGKVVHGKGLGHQLGFPTANIALDEPRKLLPPQGVYVSEVLLPDGACYRAILNIGTNPTVNAHSAASPVSIELHIPDLERNLYDLHLSVQLIHFLRPERKFGSLEELRRQISKDLAML